MNETELKQLLNWKRCAVVFLALFVLIVVGLFVWNWAMGRQAEVPPGEVSTATEQLQQQLDELQQDLESVESDVDALPPDQLVDEANRLLNP